MPFPYLPSSLIWVKCGALFWPAQVVDTEAEEHKDLREDLRAEKRQPKLVAKFFNEDGYEFVYEEKNVFEYNCARKEEFIRKGVAKSRSAGKDPDSYFAKFPRDIRLCEEMTGGDPDLLQKPPFAEEKKKSAKVDYKAIFADPAAAAAAAASPAKAKAKAETPGGGGRKRKAVESPRKSGPPEKQRPIVHPRFRPGAGGSDHRVKVMVQPSAPFNLDMMNEDEKNKAMAAPSSDEGVREARASPAAGSSSGGGSGGAKDAAFKCSFCDFSANRMNVLVLHTRTHR